MGGPWAATEVAVKYAHHLPQPGSASRGADFGRHRQETGPTVIVTCRIVTCR
jgi:hypothetical protein